MTKHGELTLIDTVCTNAVNLANNLIIIMNDDSKLKIGKCGNPSFDSFNQIKNHHHNDKYFQLIRWGNGYFR